MTEDRGRALLGVFEAHFRKFENDQDYEFRQRDNANTILFVDKFGGSALGIWKIDDQISALHAIESALQEIASGIEALAPSVRNTLLSPIDQNLGQAVSPFVQLDEIRPALLKKVAATKEAAKTATREPGQRTRERTTYRAATIAFWCRQIWAFETGMNAPRKINAARIDPPFGRFLQDVFNVLKIGIAPASALDALDRIEHPQSRKEKRAQ